MSDAISLTKDAKKPHRTSKSGAKATKKKEKGGKVRLVAFVQRSDTYVPRNVAISVL